MSDFKDIKAGLGKIQKNMGAETLMIETVPLPDKKYVVDLRFKGSLSDFGKVLDGLQDLKSMYAIETVPLPEKIMIDTMPVPDDKPMIGSWPTPEQLKKSFVWTICASKQSHLDSH